MSIENQVVSTDSATDKMGGVLREAWVEGLRGDVLFPQINTGLLSAPYE